MISTAVQKNEMKWWECFQKEWKIEDAIYTTAQEEKIHRLFEVISALWLRTSKREKAKKMVWLALLLAKELNLPNGLDKYRIWRMFRCLGISKDIIRDRLRTLRHLELITEEEQSEVRYYSIKE